MYVCVYIYKEGSNCSVLILIHFYAVQECYRGGTNGADYRGYIGHTKSGKVCQNWNSQKPHTHEWTPEKYAPCNI